MTIMKIDDLRANCTLVAARIITGKSDEEILKAARSDKVKYVDNRGLHNWQWTELYLMLGAQLGKGMYTHELRDKIPGSRRKDEDGWTRYAGITISKVMDVLKVGTYLVTTRSHIFVIADGKLMDPNYGKAALGRNVTQVIEVLNPHRAERIGKLKLARGNKRQRGTRAWFAYEQMRRILVNGPLTRQQLLDRCANEVAYGHNNEPVTIRYNSTDLAWDIRRGNVVEI